MDTDDHHMQFLDMVLEAFGDKVANLKKISPSSPLSEYWERGYQVVVVYKNSDITKMEQYNGLAWNSGYIRSPWPEANTTDMLRTRLVESSTSKRHPKAFFVLQGILTPDGELIKNFNLMKKFYKVYINGFPGAKELRNQMMLARDFAEIQDICKKYLV